MLVTDTKGAAVAGATVTVRWSGGVTGTATAKTNKNGWAYVSKSMRGSPGPVELKVENVSKSGLTYDPTYDLITSVVWTP